MRDLKIYGRSRCGDGVSMTQFATRVDELKPIPNICGAASTLQEFLSYLDFHKDSLTKKTASIKIDVMDNLDPTSLNELRLHFPDISELEDFSLRFIATIIRHQKNSRNPLQLRPFDHYLLTNQPPNNGLSFVDLFCGAGGLSLGFEQAGLSPVYAIDNDPWSIYTYSFNRPWLKKSLLSCLDISDFRPESIQLNDLDVLCAGIPCQSFSLANQQRSPNDPRDKLYTHFLECAKKWKPKILVIENVSGFSKVNDDIIQSLNRLGYAARAIEIDVSKIGMPQSRKRLLYIASRDYSRRIGSAIAGSIAGDVISTMNKEPSNLMNAIEDLEELSPTRIRNQPTYESAATGFGATLATKTWQKGNTYLAEINSGLPTLIRYNHKARYNNDRDIEIFSRLRPGEDSTAKSIADIMPYHSRSHVFKDKYFKLWPQRPCRTITSHMRYDCNTYIHPYQPRGLTAREAARIQGFPDNYIFCGTFQRTYQQIGNAVPPPLAKIIGKAISSNI